MADIQEGIQSLGKQDRSIADEVQQTVREKRTLRFWTVGDGWNNLHTHLHLAD